MAEPDNNNDIPGGDQKQTDLGGFGSDSASALKPPATADPTANIADRLAQKEGGGEKVGAEGGATAEMPLMFDISKLGPEQLQQLKAMLAATPERMSRKKQNPRVRIRRIDGNLVVDFQNAFLGLVDDPTMNRKLERHIIPVRFLGSETYENILYSKFINSEQVPCEVLSTRTHEDEVEEGVTISRETGTPVEMIRKTVQYWFTIKLPEGSTPETVEIEGKVANG